MNKSTKLKTVTTLPAWFSNLPENYILNSNEISSLFGYSSVQAFNVAVTKGSFPKADVLNAKLPTTYSRNKSYYGWNKATVLAEIQKRNLGVL